MATKKTGKPKEDTAAQLTARLDAAEGRLDAIEGVIATKAIQDQAPGPYAPLQVDERLTRIETLLGMTPTNVTNDAPGSNVDERLSRLEHRVFNELSN